MGSVREGIIHIRLHSSGSGAIPKTPQRSPSVILYHCLNQETKSLVLLVLLLKRELEAWWEDWHAVGVVKVHWK